MTIPDSEIIQQLSLGEVSRWEFKQIVFKGLTPENPSRNDFADELGAFANGIGGVLLCGVTDEGQIQNLSREQMIALDHLLAEVCSDTLDPPLNIAVYHRELDGKKFILVEVPQSDSVHERGGQAYIRRGSSTRRMNADQRLRLAQNRAQNRFISFDKRAVSQTGFNTLSESLWESLLSTTGSADPRNALKSMSLLTSNGSEIDCATVAGVLLCTKSPHQWLPQATIVATHYRGLDRTSGQLDSQEIFGPLHAQVSDALRFVVRNMRVAARKRPGREDMPQYSERAVFEAVVNAVAHRDYSMSQRRIRLSMFKDRLEIESPGQLPNGMTIEGMVTSLATRNEAIASVFMRMAVETVPGSTNRQYLMERRGDGVSIILKETQEIAGVLPKYELINQSSLLLTIPAAKLELSPADATITVHSNGEPLSNVHVLVIFPNKTWQQTTTNDSGEATFGLYTNDLPMTVYAAAEGFTASIMSGHLNQVVSCLNSPNNP